MSRARDNANLGAQAGSGLTASDLTTGTLGNTVQDNITRVGTVGTGTWEGTTIKTAYIGDDQVTEDKLADTLLAEIDANTAKVTNSTNASDLASGTVATARLPNSASGLTFINRVALSGENTGTSFTDLYDAGGDVAFKTYKILLNDVNVSSNGDSVNIYFYDQTGSVLGGSGTLYHMTLDGRANDGTDYNNQYNGTKGHFCINVRGTASGVTVGRGFTGEYLLTGLKQPTGSMTAANTTAVRFVGSHSHFRSDDVEAVGNVSVTYFANVECWGFQMRAGTSGGGSFTNGYCTVFGVNES